MAFLDRMKSKRLTKKPYPERAADMPVTQKMLYGIRDEMMSKFISLEHKMNAGFEAVGSDVQSVRADVQSLKADVQSVKADVHRVLVLVEEQNARNAIVFDGLTSLFGRQ